MLLEAWRQGQQCSLRDIVGTVVRPFFETISDPDVLHTGRIQQTSAYGIWPQQRNECGRVCNATFKVAVERRTSSSLKSGAAAKVARICTKSPYCNLNQHIKTRTIAISAESPSDDRRVHAKRDPVSDGFICQQQCPGLHFLRPPRKIAFWESWHAVTVITRSMFTHDVSE